MSTKTTHPRLNPFAFTADTDFRFILLIVAVMGAGLFIFNWFYYSLPGTGEALVQTARYCLETQPDLSDIDSIHANADYLRQCTLATNRSIAAWQLGGLVLLLIVAFAIYWLWPTWKIRREKLVALTAEDDPALIAELGDLCQIAGLSRRPAFLLDPLNGGQGGLAFGHFGRHYVLLQAGLLTRYVTDRPAFRSVVLHELAHLRNRDVDKAYFTMAIWYAFVLTALLPLALDLLLTNSVRILVGIGWRAAVLALLVYLVRNSILHARELYADIRASIWEGEEGAIRHVVAAALRPSRLPAIFFTHPHPSRRRQLIDETYHLFYLSPWDALAAGMTATIAFASISRLLQSLLSQSPSLTIAPILAALIFGPLVAGVIGLGVWRGNFAALVAQQSRQDAGYLGVAAGLGILAGQRVALSSSVEALSSSPASGGIAPLLFQVMWATILLLGLFLFGRWLAATADTWLVALPGSRPPQRLALVGLVISSGVLTIWLGPLFLWQQLGETNALLAAGIALLSLPFTVAQSPFTLLGFVILWSAPLAIWLQPQQRAYAGKNLPWAFLDGHTYHYQPPRLQLHPDSAVLRGVKASLLFALFLLLMRLLVRFGLPETVTTTEVFRVGYYYTQLALAVVFQGGVAAVTVLSTDRLRIVHALLAAFIAGYGSALALLGLNLLFGGSVDWTFMWIVFSQVVNGGALLALPLSLFLTTIRRIRPALRRHHLLFGTPAR